MSDEDPIDGVLITRARIEQMPERRHVHQFNANAVRLTRTLGSLAGLERIGVHVVRLTTGHDSTQHHYHDSDEEFLYILEGRGVARIGDAEHAVAAGDFMGFPAPSPPHSLHNPYPEDLVYLMGGERNPADVVHYPDITRSMIKSHGRRAWVDWQNLHDLED